MMTLQLPERDEAGHRKFLETMNIDPDQLPKPIEPEYKSWSLEKLQAEYFKVRMELSGLRIQKIDVDHRVEKTEAFIYALKDLLEDE